MITLLLALSVTVEPAFGLECRPAWNAGASVIEASNDGDSRRVTVEITDYQGYVAEVELDLPARSHKRLVLMPPLGGRVEMTLVAEDGTRTPLPYPFRQECKGPAVAALVREDGRAGFAIPADIAGTPVEVGELRREDLPGSWRPLMSLAAIVAEARALNELSDAEFALLEQWTRSGGVLVVVPGLDPAPLFRSGRLPEGSASPSGDFQSVPWGAGAVAVTDPTSQNARLASLILVTAADRDSWGKAVSRIFDGQVDRAGPAGRTSRPAGMLSLGAVLVAAAIAHELLRRRFIIGVRNFDSYFRGTGIVFGVAALSGLLSAFVGSGKDASLRELVVAHSSGSGILSRAWVVPAGRTQPLAESVWPHFERDARFVLGARTAVRNSSGGPRVVLERTPIDLDGAVSLDSATHPTSIANETATDFEAGWIVEARQCRRIVALSHGSRASVPQPERCPVDAAVAIGALSAQTTGKPWYVARAGNRAYAVELESP